MNEEQPDQLLTRYLAEHDAPCPVCAYNLRGLIADTCPECGTPVRLGVVGKPRVGSGWAAGTLFWCAAATVSLLVISLLIRRYWVRNEILPILFGIAGIVIFCPGAIMFLKRPGWFFRQSALVRWSIALVPPATPLVIYIILRVLY